MKLLMNLMGPLALASCVSVGASSCTYLVAGDSTAQQVSDAITQTIDLTQPGCGWSTTACVVPLGAVSDGDLVIAFVSVHDRNATDLDGYRQATDHYTAQGADVVWVAVPELAAPYYGVTAQQMVDLNDAVRSQLGCELAPETLRHGPMVDGIHYTEAGAIYVAVALETVTEPTCI